MIWIGNLKKNSYISLISVAKPKNFIFLAFTHVLDSFALSYGNFCMDFYSVNSGEAMQRRSKAMKR